MTDLVRERIQHRIDCNHAVTAEMKVMLTLRYLAMGKMQVCNGDDFGLSQPMISRVISQTSIAVIM